ncbi:hypothetical protein EJ05DRAFT_363419 [Pseudovirgaria hyperparasitica]|uniref:Uncharacterized protein n=1 Tax=Pseudovirgaria hyperparasitica TaxID=470096 RepID=A0A6A6WAY7_9PEZI|nr:uncharacterized protein EJ05DRAFT_363419 [Pseudovirgaria hyperparasitica]KAF2758757.1 hypothetical protein EJ05DRAFT_363419 [Pseudovirgaria hyperparasitica]
MLAAYIHTLLSSLFNLSSSLHLSSPLTMPKPSHVNQQALARYSKQARPRRCNVSRPTTLGSTVCIMIISLNQSAHISMSECHALRDIPQTIILSLPEKKKFVAPKPEPENSRTNSPPVAAPPKPLPFRKGNVGRKVRLACARLRRNVRHVEHSRLRTCRAGMCGFSVALEQRSCYFVAHCCVVVVIWCGVAIGLRL